MKKEAESDFDLDKDMQLIKDNLPDHGASLESTVNAELEEE